MKSKTNPTWLTIMKSLCLKIPCVLSIAQLCAFGPQAVAMSMPAHLRGAGGMGGMMDLLGTPVESGGAGKMFPEKVQSIGDWMDNPALKTGRYQNHLAGGKPVHPSNHNFLRHNPDNVGKVFSGNGTVEPGAKNMARVHKIQDVFNNSRPVDGWKITREMREEAERALRHIKEYRALPERLPSWVDQQGPLIKNPKLLNTSPGSPLIGSSPRTGIALKGLGAAATIAAVAVTAHEMEKTEHLYDRGDLTAIQRGEHHGEAVGEAALGLGGALAGALLGSPAGPVGMIVGGVAGGIAGSSGGGKLGSTTLGRRLGEIYEVEEKQMAAASGKFLQAAGPMTLSPDAYRGIGLGPATERALVGDK